MSKKPIIGGIILAAIIGVVFVGAQINPDNPENEESPQLQESQEFSMKEIWRARMVGTEVSYSGNTQMATNPTGDTHKYSTITLERTVPYEFDFVAMGDSPKWLKISVGNVFSESLYLEGTLVDTGISEYYTCDYVGIKNLEISTQQCMYQKTCNYDIIVERHGDLKGSVTISLLQ